MKLCNQFAVKCSQRSKLVSLNVTEMETCNKDKLISETECEQLARQTARFSKDDLSANS